MGYTHYWTSKAVTPEKWDELLNEVNQLVEALPENIDIKGGLGEGKPEFNKENIWFNGDEKKGLDHETFMLAPDKSDWNFCKTAHKPYDLLVCAVLLAAYDILGYEVSSDGDLEDWKPAIDFYLDTIYDIQSMEQDRKNELVESILPEFLKEELKGNSI